MNKPCVCGFYDRNLLCNIYNASRLANKAEQISQTCEPARTRVRGKNNDRRLPLHMGKWVEVKCSVLTCKLGNCVLYGIFWQRCDSGAAAKTRIISPNNLSWWIEKVGWASTNWLDEKCGRKISVHACLSGFSVVTVCYQTKVIFFLFFFHTIFENYLASKCGRQTLTWLFLAKTILL